ncbi:MAG: cytidine deaminase [bacterium]
MNKKILTRLLVAAQQAARRAYAPYSNFRVGAAALTARGRIYSGANVENSSIGLSICAERVAVFKAVAAGETEIKAVLVFTPTEAFIPPCGACLQVIQEFGSDPLIILATPNKTKKLRLRQLLPHRFRLT